MRDTRSLPGLLLAAAVAAIAARDACAQTVTYSAPGFALVDAGGRGPGIASGVLTLAGTQATVAALESITLTNLSHSWLGDLSLRLTKIDAGASVVFCSPLSIRSADFDGTYTFAADPQSPTVDDIAAALGNDEIVPSGRYAATGVLRETQPGFRVDFAPFAGLPLDGDWMLSIVDSRTGNTGALGGWSVTFRPAAAPEPGSAALGLVGLAALAALRRRR